MNEERISAARARADAYRFLSRAYLQPLTETVHRGIADGRLLAELMRASGAEVPENISRLAGARADKHDRARLRQEFMDLFAVPGGRYLMPFEDVYCGTTPGKAGSRGPLLGPCAIAVKRLYRSAGAQVDTACKELPTHVGVELAFMEFLCTGEAAAMEAVNHPAPDDPVTSLADRYRAFQVHFLDTHLCRWFPALNERLQDMTREPLYAMIGQLTEVVIAADTGRPGNSERRSSATSATHEAIA